MPSVARTVALDPPLHSMADLVEHRRSILWYALVPPGPERNQHRQIALSLRALFGNREWREAHVLKGPVTIRLARSRFILEPNPTRRIGPHGAHRQ